MISRQLKAFYYAISSPIMRLSGSLYRAFKSPVSRNTKKIRVHLGPGQRNYLDGWINVDANLFTAKIDVWADLRFPLPFRDNSVDCFYSHHVIEHLPNLQRHMNELFRCLKSGGCVRIGGPNGDSAIQKYVAKDEKWFGDFPDKRDSLGGKFENFIFCRKEHLTVLTYSYLQELLEKAGFKAVQKHLPTRTTSYPQCFDTQVFSKEYEDDFDFPHTLIVEARKP